MFMPVAEPSPKLTSRVPIPSSKFKYRYRYRYGYRYGYIAGLSTYRMRSSALVATSRAYLDASTAARWG